MSFHSSSKLVVNTWIVSVGLYFLMKTPLLVIAYIKFVCCSLVNLSSVTGTQPRRVEERYFPFLQAPVGSVSTVFLISGIAGSRRSNDVAILFLLSICWFHGLFSDQVLNQGYQTGLETWGRKEFWGKINRKMATLMNFSIVLRGLPSHYFPEHLFIIF